MSHVAAIILAAGRATRFGTGEADSKVFALLGGTPLVRHVALAALASRAAQIFVVTGHAAQRMASALEGLPVTLVHNADYATGMASSLRAGIGALSSETCGALILLADMPLVRAATLDDLIAAFEAEADMPDAVVPINDGHPGNPVLVGRVLFGELGRLEQDEGARKLLREPGRKILRHAVDDPGIAIDIDTSAVLRKLDGEA